MCISRSARSIFRPMPWRSRGARRDHNEGVKPVALRHFAENDGGGWSWRCHIDLTSAYGPVWSFLRPYVREHDAAIFTMPQFAQPDLQMERAVFSAPSIDPFAEKNAAMTIDDAR